MIEALKHFFHFVSPFCEFLRVDGSYQISFGLTDNGNC